MPDLSIELDIQDSDLLTVGQTAEEEEHTQAAILERLIERQAQDLDPRPSSPNYVMSVPASFEFEADYQNVETFKINSYIHTADRDGLILRGLDFGMAPYPATYSRLKGRFNIPLALGTVFSLDDLNYTIVEAAGADDEYFYYLLDCDTPGVVGNTQLGRILPTQYVPGLDLTVAELLEVVIPGEEEEDTESFRRRLLARYQYKRFCGNRPDYIAEATGFPGVGRVKIDNYLDGETGKVFIDIYFTDSEGNVPSQELVGRLQEYFNPLDGKDRSEQTVEETGNGIAPIDHFVEVKPVKTCPVGFLAWIQYREGADIESVNEEIKEKVNAYVKSEALKWGDTEMTEKAKFPRKSRCELSYNRAGAAVLEVEGVLDYLVVNFTMGGKELEWNMIPVVDTFDIFEVQE